MKYTNTIIEGVCVIESDPYEDNRGSFIRLFCAAELNAVVGSRHIAQINKSRTKTSGAVRGLHCQRPPDAEMKLVTCLRGRVWDVAVDLRSDSNTFLKWHAEELTPLNCRTLVIPEGCAHGFQALEGDSELLYLHTAFYNPKSEIGIRPTDPRLSIPWPLALADLSARDRTHPLLAPDYSGIDI
jgi:dTDP-4-dehydrorhamnose 3,5-epimerase